MIYKRKLVASFILLLIFSIGFIFVNCNSSEDFTKGNEVANKIENFRKEKSRLPNSLTEIGIKETESGPIYYKKESESKYILWFGKGLGESVTYDSETKQWK